MASTDGTIDALKDIITFEERLSSNRNHLQKVRSDILQRWKVMGLVMLVAWCLSRLTTWILFSVLFYGAMFVFVVLVGVSLKSGRLYSAEQYRDDVGAGLLPFNVQVVGDEVAFSKRVPSDLQRLLSEYRREYRKRKGHINIT
jgi:hypothetical protein